MTAYFMGMIVLKVFDKNNEFSGLKIHMVAEFHLLPEK